jgi:hypothetical protein
MDYLVNFIHNSFKCFASEGKEKFLILSGLIILFLCLLTIFGWSRGHGNVVTSSTYSASTPIPRTMTVTPTKWWIKTTLAPSLLSPTKVMTVTISDALANNCHEEFSSLISVGGYAYVSLTPSLPNRIRSGADKASPYLGQLEPGTGLKVIDGPVCADSYAWWRVESSDKSLRGWTVGGNSSQQWVIPCPNKDVPCSFMPAPTSSSVVSKDDKKKDQNENTCSSAKLALGMYAQVHQDSLLVMRAEPYAGVVLGHAGPMSVIRIIEGPSCVGGIVWWKVNAIDLGIVGWTTENYLEPCPKDNNCNPEPA